KPATGPVPADQAKFGLGKTTPREMASVIERFENCNLSPANAPAAASVQDKQMCALAIKILKQQTDNGDIQRYLTVPVANKTGALDDVRNDVGIVYAKNGPIVISAFTYENKDQSWGPDNAAQVVIGKLAKAIVDHWQ
ncbi:MAG: serine hydrolase, partial [Candidatus Eremiobacteraeota bacterium]|nr:serine hydrolase [Candidatus Eremiobacteraeota bacterium]